MGRHITTIPSRLMESLAAWPWPGNIRELANVIERAVILSPGPVLQLAPLVSQGTPPPPVVSSFANSAPVQVTRYNEGEREMILRALRESEGLIGGPGGAAARLGLKRTTLNSKMRKLGLKRPSY